MVKNAQHLFSAGLHPRSRSGSSQRSPDSLAGFKGTCYEREWRVERTGKKEMGREMITHICDVGTWPSW